jgi:hypothetical protein
MKRVETVLQDRRANLADWPSRLRRERRTFEQVSALNNNCTPSLRARDCVVEQSSLLVSIARHSVGPQNYNTFELPIFCLVHCHGFDTDGVCSSKSPMAPEARGKFLLNKFVREVLATD